MLFVHSGMLSPHDSHRPCLPLPAWHGLTGSHIWRWPLPKLGATDRVLTKLVCLLALRRVVRIEGWDNILPQHDPFILVANHSSRREAVGLFGFLRIGTIGLFRV